MTTDQPPTAESRPKRTNRRLRALLALNVLALRGYVFVRLDRSTAEWFGPVGIGIHDQFNSPALLESVALSAAARQFMSDAKALGGEPNVAVTNPGFLGFFGRSEWFNVRFANRNFDDQALGRFVQSHGDRIGGLYLHNTGVTDAGLQHLKKLTMLRHLSIENQTAPARRGGAPAPPATVTDAGLIHLAGLTQLWSLNLSGLPITDSGLDALSALPALQGLYLNRTKVQGTGLARLKSLPGLSILCLDGSEMTEDALRALSGATGLQTLALGGVPLTDKALPFLKAIPRLEMLEITGCGLLDEEVDALVKSKPKLKIGRR